MKKFFTVLVLVFVICTSVFAAKYLSVPVDDSSYRIIDNATYRGIVKAQTVVKPYSYSLVKELLTEISSSDKLTDGEREVVLTKLKDLAIRYGETESSSFGQIMRNGYYYYGNDETNIQAGVEFLSQNRVGYKQHDGKILDSRNMFNLYFKGDMFGLFSYNANVGVNVDKVDTAAYLMQDFPIYPTANYILPRHIADMADATGILIGANYNPELSASFFDGKLNLRIGIVDRDWGPAIHNLDLSSSTKAFPAFEVSLQPFEWFHYSFLHGSLARFQIEYYEEVPWPSEHGYDTAYYDNMFSLHRADFTFGSFNIGIYENCVWRKRFELSYLVPFGIIQLIQNDAGDFDNMMFGGDITYSIAEFGKIYFGVSVDEISHLNIKHFLTDPRHIFAFQGGVSVDGKLGNLSTLTFQATYIPPFYGAHFTRLADENPWGTTSFETTYVSGGKNLFSPLDPDSVEFLLSYDVSLSPRVDLNVTVRDQARSAQYAIRNTGTDVMTTLDYEEVEDYANKDFIPNVWRNILIVDANTEISFEKLPVRLTLGVTGMIDWVRNFTVEPETTTSLQYNNGYFNPGTGACYTEWGGWNAPVFSAMANIGIKVYF